MSAAINTATGATHPDEPRAVVIGDSQAEGLAPHLRMALSPLFYVVNTVWQRGASTRALIASGKIESALAQRPDVVIFALGGNDTATDPERYQADLVEAVALAGRDGARVIWIGPARATDAAVEARHARARAVQSQVLPELGVLWLDSTPWTQTGHGPDGVHFARSAYQAQAVAIAAALTARRNELGGGPRISGWLLGGAALLGALAIGAGVWMAGEGRRQWRWTTKSRRR